MMSNYPDGAENDPRAPYNQIDPPTLEFEMEFASTLTRTTTIESDEYEGGYRDEEGYEEMARYTGNAIKEYKEQHYTLMQLLSKLICLIDDKIDAIDNVNVPTIVTSNDLTYKLNKEKAELMGYKEEALSWYAEDIETL